MDFPTLQASLRNAPPVGDDASPSTIPFVELWKPTAQNAVAVLATCLSCEPEVSVLEDLRENLTLRLSQVGEATVWARFNAHRTLKDLLDAHLGAGDRGFRRTIYRRVVEALRTDGLEDLTNEYPVLRRHLVATVASWLSASRELLGRVDRDGAVLAKRFDLPARTRLVGVKTGISDPHRGGRSVAILTFGTTDSSERTSIVYKPRDLRTEAAYHQLISEMSADTAGAAPLHSLGVLALDGYGYVEYLAHEVCTDNQELSEFYRNAGRLTAILFVLGCNDCHHENVVAHRDQLVLVDAETVLQGVPRGASSTSKARAALEARLGESVMRIGVLPHWFFVARERVPRDASALGIRPPAAETESHKGWLALNTDGMFTGSAVRSAQLPTSSPVGIGEANRLGDFITDYRAGFRWQLEAIARQKTAWLAGLERFRDLRSRFIPRPTWTYLWIRSELLEPAALRSESAQSEVLTHLDLPRRRTADARDAAVLASEGVQLRELDVPFFEHAIAGHDLVVNGTDVVPDFFVRSGLDAARHRIKSLGGDEIKWQLDLIDGLTAAKAGRAHRGGRDDSVMNPNALVEPPAAKRVEMADAVGALLLGAAITDDDGQREWLGIDAAADLERSCFGPIGPSLYGGRAGIALFLGRLASVGTSQARAFREAATAACADLLLLFEPSDGLLDKQMWWREQPLGLAGSGGQLLAALHLCDLVPDMRRAVAQGVPQLLEALDSELIRSDDDLDIIFGCAGLIGALLRIATPKSVDLACMAGDRLVERQDKNGGWIVPALGTKALTGFSHGASGVAAALARLASAKDNRPYKEAAARALTYERTQYDPGTRNWLDLRAGRPATSSPSMLGWCHGAPGIALARLCMKSTPLWDEKAADDLDLALAATVDLTWNGNSLCCGRVGRAAILRAANDRDGQQRWLEAAGHLEAQALAQICAGRDYDFGSALGLFQGAAGIGLEFLDCLQYETGPLVPHLLSAGLID